WSRSARRNSPSRPPARGSRHVPGGPPAPLARPRLCSPWGTPPHPVLLTIGERPGAAKTPPRGRLRRRRRRSHTRAMKISLIQMNTQERKDANLAQAERLIDAAVAEDRPDLVLLPEMFTMLSENLEAKRANAEVLPPRDGSNAPPGEAYALLQRLAARHRVHVHGGSLLERATEDGGERFFNTSV